MGLIRVFFSLLLQEIPIIAEDYTWCEWDVYGAVAWRINARVTSGWVSQKVLVNDSGE